MKKHSLALVLMLTSLLGASSAMAFAGVSLVGGVNNGFYTAGSYKGGLSYDGGLLFNFGMVGHSLEIGALYEDRGDTLGGADVTLRKLSIPVMIRFGGLLGLGFGGYYDVALTSGAESDYGVVAGPSFHLVGGLFLDARFKYGINTLNVGTGDFHNTQAVFLIGYRFK